MNDQLHTGRITQKQKRTARKERPEKNGQKRTALCPSSEFILTCLGISLAVYPESFVVHWYWVNMIRYSGAMMERLLINANATMALLQAPLSIITAAGSLPTSTTFVYGCQHDDRSTLSNFRFLQQQLLNRHSAKDRVGSWLVQPYWALWWPRWLPAVQTEGWPVWHGFFGRTRRWSFPLWP